MQRFALIASILAMLFTGQRVWADDTPAAATAPSAPSPTAPPTPLPATAPSTSPPTAPSASPPTAPETPPAASAATPISPAAKPIPPPAAVQSVSPQDAIAILGQRVTGPDGKDIGRLVDVLVDANGQPQAAVIDFGGFMGVGNRKIAVHWSALRFTPADKHEKIALEMTPDQIKAAPEFRNPKLPAPVVTPADVGTPPR